MNRQRLRHRRHLIGEAFAVGGQLLDLVVGRGRLVGRLFGHAARRRLSGDRQMATRTRTL